MTVAKGADPVEVPGFNAAALKFFKSFNIGQDQNGRLQLSPSLLALLGTKVCDQVLSFCNCTHVYMVPVQASNNATA